MSDLIEGIEENIQKIRKKVEIAAGKSGRKFEDIHILAVTKTVGTDDILKAAENGLSVIGENRVQEIMDKYPILKDKCKFHLIGHLQTNKVKYVIDKVEMIHSLDRMELAREIQKRAEKAGIVMNCLVQVNVSGEESKFGMKPLEVIPFLKKVSLFSNIKIKGLMTIAPYTDSEILLRKVFADLRKLYVDIQLENIDNISMEYLSMGMSNDYEIAIEEGANIVRIGTAIFGKRNYSL